MAKQLNVNLSFSADTSKARAQLQDLQRQLTNLVNMPSSQLPIGDNINEAVRSAAELKTHLEAAVNVKTGNLDFAKLNQSIGQSGKSLEQYAMHLRSLGPTGQQAFLSLANSVASAEIPIRRSNAALREMWTTLKNTARWQLSSSILHGFMGALQSAHGYAKDLNKSLNDIRIVTGHSAEEMAKFAKEANKAARALSATTTDYTNASLIYYQQGLDEQQVKERTEVTLKMANVTRQSSVDVSDQMTAIWNNFYNGSKSLEYYADVITALGAATASSSDEISEGLNKFAAVAETVGLSYEYAASALATVTSTTRQSADVVGTAFKTLFARIQGLNLGETLDDGTTLNKYSEALDKVGIDIKDLNGEIKGMDQILDEMGAKWNTLGKDQQIALAQTVAGVRQYTQLIALMDNWDYFQENLGVANTSAGALQSQAEIYAEGWEAAGKRVKAAAQAIYEDLIDDEFFIDLLNKVEKILGFIDNLIDGFGGLKGVLMVISTLMTKIFAQQMSQGITNMAYNLQMSTKAGRQKVQAQRISTLNNMVGMLPENEDYTGKVEETRIATMRETIDLQASLTEKAERMSQLELTTNQYLLDRVKILSEQSISAAQGVEQAEARQSATIEKAQSQIAANYMADHKDTSNAVQGTKTAMSSLADRQKDIKNLSLIETTLLKVKKQSKLTDKEITDLQKSFGELGTNSAKQLKPIFEQLQAIDKESEDWEATVDNLQIALNLLYGEQKKMLTSPNGKIGIDSNTADEMITNAHNIANANNVAQQANEDFAKGASTLEEGIKNASGAQATWADGLVAYAGAISAVTGAIQSVVGLIDVWNDKDMSFGEKMLTTFSTLAMIIPMLITSIGRLNVQQMASFTASLAQALGFKGTAAAAELAAAGTATFGTVLYTVLWPLGLITAALLLIVGIFYLFSKANAEVKTAVDYATEALADQEKVVNELNETLSATKTALSDVKSLLEEYYDLDSAFDNLVEGSYEWLETLQKQNEVINELLKKYPELLNMGAIGLKDGRYQILDEGLVNQYVLGVATLDSLVAQMAVAAAEKDLRDRQIDYNKAREWQLSQENYGSEKWMDAPSLVGSTKESDNFQDPYQRVIIRASDNSQFVVDADIHNSALPFNPNEQQYITVQKAWRDVQSLMMNSLYKNAELTTEELISNITNELGYHEDFVRPLVEGMYTYQETYIKEIKRINDYEILQRRQATQEYLAKYQQLATSLLFHQKGFGDLNNLQQSAAAVLGRDILTRNVNKYSLTTYDYAKNDELSTDVVTSWANMLGLSELNDWHFNTASGGKKVAGGDDPILDAGDFFRDSQLGSEFLKMYLEDSGLENVILNDETVTDRTPTKLTYKDGDTEKEISYASIFEYIGNKAAYEATSKDFADLIASMDNYSNAVLAGIAGDVSSLSPEEIDQIANQQPDDTYKLDTTSKAYKDAEAAAGFAQYDATKTDLSEEDWNIAKATWQEDLVQSINAYDAALARTKQLQEEMATGNAKIAQAAEAYDLDAEAVENYAKSLYNLNKAQGITYEQAANLAIANARLSKGLSALTDCWDDAKKVMNTYTKDSYEYFEAIAEVQAALSDVFGIEVSADFVEKYKEDIDTLVKGGEEAEAVFQKLETAAGKDYVASLAIDDKYKTQFNQLLDDLTMLENNSNFTIGFEGQINQSYIDSLNNLLSSGALTVDQIQGMFNSIGWDPDISYKEQSHSSEAINQIFTGDTKAEVMGGVGESWERIVTTSTTQVPVIGNSAKAIPKSASSVTTRNTGSGGGGSKKEKKNLDTEKERYYEIEQALGTIANKLDKVGAAKERAFGKAKSDLIKQEIALLDEEIAKQQELLDEIAKHAETDMANLAAFGFTFDENNNITNYDEIIAQEIARYNAAIDSGDEAAIAAAEERWRLLQEYLKQFEETMDKWDEETLKEMQKKYERYAKLFEDLTYSIQVKLDIDEDKLKLLDHALAMLEHQSFSTAEAIALMGDKTAAVLSQIKTYSEGITGLLSLHNIDEDTLAGLMDGSISLEELQDEYGFSDEDIAKLREYRDGLLAANEKLAELRNTVQEKVMESFQEWNEEMDRGIAKIEYLGGVLESYKNIVDLVGKSHLGLDDEFMKNMSKAQVANANDNLRANKAKYDAAVKARENAELELAKARERGDEESVKQWEKTLKRLDEEVQGAHQDMMSSWETALEAASNAFEEAVERTITTFEEAISGTFGSLEDLQAAFDQQTEITERYVDDYKKIYELSKLNRDIINSIDETDNVKAKRALRDLQEEINELQESNTQMSQYDLDHLRKKYELRLAEIALEEAQNAKTQVRMRKDSEGNYSYVFTADENEVEKARQNYEDKLYEMQELNTAYIREMQANILQSEIELANALRALDRSKFASDADYYAEVQRLTDYYTGQRNYNLDELNKGITNNRETYNEDWRSYSDLTGYKISADQQYLDSFNETVYAQLTGYQSIEDAQARFADATHIMVESLKQAYVDWQAAVKLIMETAGTSVENFAKDAGDAIGKISEDSSEAAGDVEEMAKDFEEAFKKVLDSVTQWQIDYSEAITAAIEANTAMATSCTSLIEMLSGLNGGLDVTTQKFAATAAQIEDAAKRIQQACDDAANVSNTTNKTTPPPKDPPDDPPKDLPKTEPKTMSGYAYSYGGKLYGPFITEKVAAQKAWDTYKNKNIDIVGIVYEKGKDLNSGLTAQTLLGQVKDFINTGNKTNANGGGGGGSSYDPLTVMAKYDTGGYTGSWGSSGRMAMLHQKELVLNAQDTENMLKTVDMVRNIVRVIDLNAGSHSGGLGYIGATYSGHNAQVIEQEVTIHAEFPNAVNHTEIEMAFDNLINHASQFANRIKK